MLTLSVLLVHKQAHKWNKPSLASTSGHSSAKWKSTQAMETTRCVSARQSITPEWHQIWTTHLYLVPCKMPVTKICGQVGCEKTGKDDLE